MLTTNVGFSVDHQIFFPNYLPAWPIDSGVHYNQSTWWLWKKGLKVLH